MWNWLVGGLATGASIFLFDGAPVYPKIDILLEYCQNKKINLFGVSAKYIDHLKNEKYDSKNLNLSSVKIITSTGSPLAEESFKYIYDNIKPHGAKTSLGIPVNVVVVGVGPGQGLISSVVCDDEERPNEKEKFNFRRGRINCSLNDTEGWRWFGNQFSINLD